MTVLDRITRGLGLTRAQGLPSDVAPYLYNEESVGAEGVGPPTDAESWLQQYGSAGWVYICANRIARKSATADFALYTEDVEGTKQYIKQHIWLDVLSRPNDMMSEVQLWMLLRLHLELVGEAFWYINRNVVGGPAAIYPLIPSFVYVVPGKGSQMIQGYIYDVAGERVAFDPEEVIHFFYPNPDPANFFRGASPLSALKYTLAAHANAEVYNYQFFRNSAQPGGYLATDHALDRVEVNRLRRMWEQQHRGQNNWHKVAVATNGLTFQEVGISHKDMDFVNQMNNSRETILAAFGVPKSQVGLVQDVNKATALSDEQNFATQTIGPGLVNISSTMNTFVLPMFEQSLKCEFINVLPRDEAVQMNRHKTYGSMGALTINDIRLELGKPKVPWGDVPIIQANLVPLDSPSRDNAPTPGQAPTPPGEKPSPAADNGNGANPNDPGAGTTPPGSKEYVDQVIEAIYKEAKLQRRAAQ